MTSPPNDPAEFFATARWVAGVIGLGYVGLPLAVQAAELGLDVVGFDIDRDVVETLAEGSSHVGDVSGDDLQAALGAGLRVTTDAAELGTCDALFIAVPSPLGRSRQPDLSYIEAAVETVAGVARPGMLVCLESTTYPGTSEEVVVPALENAGLKLDQEVHVAFSPERVNPGSSFENRAVPKVVGGVTPESGRVAAAAYSRLFETVHVVSSARAAEMAKLIENTYRAVNIGLVNEMAQLAHELDIDIWEVIEAAATKPYGFHVFYPGPGVGGHCIPLDPQYLAFRAREARFSTRFIDIAEQVNTAMPRYTADRIAEVLNQRGLPVYGTEILGLGVAYKPGVVDSRESASIEVLELLDDRGARITVYDPIVGTEGVAALGFLPVDPADLGHPAIAVVLTDHDEIDLQAIADAVPIVFDTRGAFRRRGIDRDNVVTL